jgi:acetyltransferase
MKICKLDAAACREARFQLVDLLLDAVANGAAPGFLSGSGSQAAERYWSGVETAVAEGSRLLLAAAHEGTLVATVQLDLCQRPNGSHRAEVQKMMVHSRVRRRGLGSVLLRAVEAEARELRRPLLFLDTEAGSGAEQLYHCLGYTRVGEIPANAGAPGGRLQPTAIYYKSLFAPEAA